MLSASLSWNNNSFITFLSMPVKKTYIEEFTNLAIFFRIRSWSLNIIRCRVVIGVLRHEGKVSLAAATADLNSSLVVNGIWETTSWVAYDDSTEKINDCPIYLKEEMKLLCQGLTGFITSTDSDACESTKLPPIKFGILWYTQNKFIHNQHNLLHTCKSTSTFA